MRVTIPETASEPPPSDLKTVSPNKDLTGHKLLILVDDDLPDGYQNQLHKRFPGLQVVHRRINPWKGATPELTDEDWATVTVLLTAPLLPEAEQAPKMQLVQLQSAGANYVLESSLFKDTKIPFCTASGARSPAIAEWVMCTYLAHQHRIPHYLDNMRDGYWEPSWDDADGQDAVTQRVGILGYGSIGRQIARVATALGMEVYAYTNRAKPTPASRRDHNTYHPPGLGDPDGILPTRWFSGSTAGERAEFLASGLDLLVVAVPLTPDTRGMLGAREFELLATTTTTAGATKRGRTYVANVGRGATVVTDDLVAALEKGWIRGAALDVTDPEPLPREHPLWRRKDVIITPHVSGNSGGYYTRMFDVLDINLGRLSEGMGEFVNHVSRKRGY